MTSNRYFEDAQQTQLYQQYRIKAPKLLVERVIAYLKNKCPGTDISANQIAIANKSNERSNVTFELSSAEKTNLTDGSVQLITAMAAAHWFDLPKFYEEGRRVLSPGGVMAIYSYRYPKFFWPRNPSKSEAIQKIYDEATMEGELADYYAPCLKLHVLSNYRTIAIPYEDLVRDESTQAKGDNEANAFVDGLKSRILEIMKEDLTTGEEANPGQIILIEKSPMTLIMARKSSWASVA
ncbi:unnamed protein product [Allacma fusca]|uniref:Methyltransferase type 11 domain-containing protein n=1 Tax=Allacma fusca TaxID=39272 RepID=A0A8J2KLD5_9HEXA|nr:unnamed protein product [Allacma fusca]